MMPVTQLVALLRSSPPKGAAGLITAIPMDRLSAVVAAMRPADVGRLLPATRPDMRGSLVEMLSTDQLAELLRTAPSDQALVLVSALPPERLGTVIDELADEVVAHLLGRLPANGRHTVFDVMGRRREYVVRSQIYVNDVADALARANADVDVPNGAPNGILVVQKMGWRIVVAARYGDDGRVAVRDAVEGAYRLRATGALAVSDHQPADDVVRYCQESQRQGRLVDAVMWAGSDHDSPLKRTLVRLFQ
jgi:hypothetical protein